MVRTLITTHKNYLYTIAKLFSVLSYCSQHINLNVSKKSTQWWTTKYFKILHRCYLWFMSAYLFCMFFIWHLQRLLIGDKHARLDTFTHWHCSSEDPMNSYNNVTHYQVRSKSCILDENKVPSKEANLGLGARGGSREGRKQKNL